MQRSSESIACLAAALAKAQAELVNPEKSQVATIEPVGRGGGAKSFRYAPLSSGLDIVRKTLGQHEIAIVQTTAIDQAAGTVNLTTVLAHASGEWIASDWPVCAISETATPHRMGAALTYARRYALFTLVGIAGEDDLDAPDLVAPAQTTSRPKEGGNGLNRKMSGPDKQSASQDAKAKILMPAASAELRDRLAVELNQLGSADDAALWARRSLPEKNRLTNADAQSVEQAFHGKLATLTADAKEPDDPVSVGVLELPGGNRGNGSEVQGSETGLQANGIDKSLLAYPEPRRLRDREHVKFVAKQPCLICGRRPSDPHHLRFAQPQAIGRKVSDEFTVPLCRGHHRQLHLCGDERSWWRTAGIDPTIAARKLWLVTHPLPSGAAELDNSAVLAPGDDVDRSRRKRGGKLPRNQRRNYGRVEG
jgi:ERF superfamily